MFTYTLLILHLLGFTCEVQGETIIKSQHGDIHIFKKRHQGLLGLLNDYISSALGWDFQYEEQGDSAGKKENALNLHWTASIPLADAKDWKFVMQMNRLANKLGGGEYQLVESFASIVRFGDTPAVISGTSNSPRDIFMVFHLSEYPAERSCSELLFYNNASEIFAVVPSRLGDLVVWKDGPSFTLRPPCSGSFVAGRVVFFRFSTNKPVHLSGEQGFANLMELKGLPELVDEKVNVGKYLTRKFYDKHGYVIATFDGLFSEEDLLKIRKAVLIKGGFNFADHQNAEDDDYDNVSWMSAFKVSSVLSSKVWKIIEELAEYFSGHGGWHPYDVSNNVIERATHTRIHEDCEGKEYEYTFLLYLNPNWTENMYGETIFFEKAANTSDVYETIVAVKPKFGRVCFFRNIISHSARPPSPVFDGSRYTFAVKVASTKKISMAKMLREALENIEGDDNEALKKTLHDGTIGGKDVDMTEAQLEGAYLSAKEEQSNLRTSEVYNAMRQLRGL